MKVRVLETFATFDTSYSKGTIGELADELAERYITLGYAAKIEDKQDATPVEQPKKVKLTRKRGTSIEAKKCE